MKKSKISIMCIVFTAVLCLGVFSYDEIPGVVNNIPLPHKANVIVQLFNWKYRDIEKILPELKKYGYSHIHVSPPQQSNEQGKLCRKWYGRYQPVDFRKISGPLGNESEFRQMNIAADRYGIKIIADVVINHMAGGNYKTLNGEKVMIEEKYPDFTPADFHPFLEIVDWNNPKEVQNGWLYGDLPDLDTSSPGVRIKLRNYLKKLLSLGVDGFRIDAAIHISPQDLSAIFKDVSPDILVFCEISRKDPAAMKPYSDMLPYMDFYDFPLVNTMKQAFSPGGDLGILVAPASSGKALAGEKAITFVTNHDIDRGYAYPKEEGMDDSRWQISGFDRPLAYAYIFGREDGLPYVFVDMKNPKAAIDVFPDESYDRPEILAGIRFHNLFLGKSEKWLDIKTDRLIWQRGDSGLVVINKSAANFSVDNFQTSLRPGIYTEIRHGYKMEVDKESKIKNWNFNGQSAYFFARTGDS
ncbi:MAG: alpha-amylase family glycosyl hydrolase [Victivallaceae bacterium]|nr:alpha-amylase family glycosyl hydrolase [Victivallaceae bacterium]